MNRIITYLFLLLPALSAPVILMSQVDTSGSKGTLEHAMLSEKNSFFYVNVGQYPVHDATLPIGVFDSGTGGLTILNALATSDSYNNVSGASGPDHIADFRNEKFIYLADQANMPYGNYFSEHKSALLVEHVLKNVQFFLSDKYYRKATDTAAHFDKEPVKAIVIACNTATAYAKAAVEKFVNKTGIDVKVIGVIDAGAEGALKVFNKTEDGSVAVLATVGTIASKGYENAILDLRQKLNYSGNIQIFNQAGYGVAESVDGEPDFVNIKATRPRDNYRGPALNSPEWKIDKALKELYRFDFSKYKMLCDADRFDDCEIIQINSADNYIRYNLVSLMEKMRKTRGALPLRAIVLGCTHYPYLLKEIRETLSYLYNYRKNGVFVYRPVMNKDIQIIDPAVFVVQEVYDYLHTQHLFNPRGDMHKSEFFISIPNAANPNVKLDQDGRFLYEYKYGRNANEVQEYVKIVPFQKSNISRETITRIKEVMPSAYALIRDFENTSSKTKYFGKSEKLTE